MFMPNIDINELVKSVRSFFPKKQLQLVIDQINDRDSPDWIENRNHYIKLLLRFKKIFQIMPKTYETENQGGEAVVYLHYFIGGCDWWIIERDVEEKQRQAFGVVCLNSNTPEFGYISIDELTTLDIRHSSGILLSVELDFYWKQIKLKDIPELSNRFS